MMRIRIAMAAATLLFTLAPCTAVAQNTQANSEAAGLDAVLAGLQQARDIVDANSTPGSIERAEGYRFILRRIEHNLGDLAYESDTAHPIVQRCPSRVCKLGFDNPDNSYISVGPLSADLSYRVYGTRGSVPLILFQIFNRPPQWGGGATLDSGGLVVEESGEWQIVLSAERPDDATNWMQLDDESDRLIVRNSFYDWNGEDEPAVQVEVLGGSPGPVAHFDPAQMRHRGVVLGRTIPAQVQSFVAARKGLELHDFVAPNPGSLGGTTGGFPLNFTSRSNYQLAKDEALIIESPRAEVAYHNIQLGNVWLESLDYASRQTSLNASQAHLDADGVYRYVLAHEDPGVPNWLDVSGHPRGSVFMRWAPANPKAPPAKPGARVVKLEALREHLPADTPQVSEGERRRILDARMAGFNRRTNPAGL